MTTSWSFSFDSLGTPGHLRRSANGPASISWHNFQLLRWMVSSVDAVFFSNVNSKFTASALGCSEETLFISFSKGVTVILRYRTCLEKDTNECSCLICDSSCCRTSCVSVQPCTPKVLPNTETFLHSRVFFVTCVVPALCQIMYSLSVCSDGTTSAAPRSFRQNRPPARTLSLTYFLSLHIDRGLGQDQYGKGNMTADNDEAAENNMLISGILAEQWCGSK